MAKMTKKTNDVRINLINTLTENRNKLRRFLAESGSNHLDKNWFICALRDSSLALILQEKMYRLSSLDHEEVCSFPSKKEAEAFCTSWNRNLGTDKGCAEVHAISWELALHRQISDLEDLIETLKSKE